MHNGLTRDEINSIGDFIDAQEKMDESLKLVDKLFQDKSTEEIEKLLNPNKSHKNKFIRWLYWKVYFRIRLKILKLKQ